MTMDFAVMSTAVTGIAVAVQAVAVPHDLKSWPVTAMLVLLVILSLGLVTYMAKTSASIAEKNAEAAIETAKAITSLKGKTEEHDSNIRHLSTTLHETNSLLREHIARQ